MKFAVKYLSQFVDKLPEDISILTKQLVNLGIELESVTIDAFGNNILEVSVPPNRSDLLGIVGIARELAAVNNTQLKIPESFNIQNNLDKIDKINININIPAPQGCPKYVFRVISNINTKATTPIWMQEVLNNAGIDLILPIVDITNYVMLELGQPLHAFDLNKVSSNNKGIKEIVVRSALNSEEIILLNNNKIRLTAEDLIIADLEKPLAIAGIMGGLDAGITTDTNNIIIESAYFDPIKIRTTSVRHNILTDSSQRFAKVIDPNLQEMAIQRFSNLLQEIAGGDFSDIDIKVNEKYLPAIAEINLNKDKIKQVLGFYPPEQKIVNILQSLTMVIKNTYSGWKITVPTWRQDIKIQEDLIEEIARFIGYNNIKQQKISLPLAFKKPSKKLNFTKELEYKNCLVHRGYSEIISYSFIDVSFADKFYSNYRFYELKNPIAKTMNVMRPGLLVGLFMALIYNQNRQQTRVRLFEVGTVFILDPKTAVVAEHKRISGIVNGKLLEENWQNSKKTVDFFGLKSDIMALMHLEHKEHNENIHFKPTNHPGLHPLQAANIYIDNVMVGVVGAIHPELSTQFSIVGQPFVFELDLRLISNSQLPKFIDISRFPSIRRDFSITVNVLTTCENIQQVVQASCGELLKKIIFFDVYSGDKLPDNKKSIAFGIILQSADHTLVEHEINNVVSKLITNLEQVGAKLRI